MVDLGSSDVAYEGDLFSKEERFKPTFYEWLFSNGQEIIKTTATNGVFYTVPDNYDLYITYIRCCVTEDGTGAVGTTYTSGLIAKGSLGFASLMALGVQGGTKTNENAHVSLIHPIHLRAGDTIELGQSGNVDCSTGFIGYLLPSGTGETIHKIQNTS